MNLAEKTILNILAKSSQAVLLMLSSIVMVRYFPKHEYGTFLQIMLITNTVIMFSFMGLPQSIYYYYHRVINQPGFIVRNVILSICVGGIVAFIVYLLKDALSVWFNNPLLAEYGLVLALIIFFQAPSYFREALLISHGSLIINSIFTVCWNLIFFGPIIIVAFFSVTLNVLLNVLVMSCLLLFCLYLSAMAWIWYHTETMSSLEADEANEREEISLKTQLWYSLPIGLSSYIGTIGRQIDQYIVSIFFLPRDYAIYSRGAMRIPVLDTIQFTINDIMMPHYVKAYKAGDIETFLRDFHLCTEKVAKIKYPVFALLFAVAPSIMTFLYTEEYVDAASILRVYICLLLSSVTVYGIIPRASGQTSSILRATILSLVVNVTFSLLLVSRIGSIGAAIATVASVIITAIYYLHLSCRILGVSFTQIFPWKYLAELLLVCLTASIPVYIMEYLFSPQGGKLFFLLLADGVVYVYCLLFLLMRTHLIHHDDIELFQKWLKFDVEKVLKKITLIP